MHYGSAFPNNSPADVHTSRHFALSLEEAAFDFVTAGAHIVSRPAGSHPDRPIENYVGPYYDVFILLSYMAAITTNIRLISGLVIAPALPTVLVGKQAAELAFFSHDRFELGLGISWNAAEYEALGQRFPDRGRRLEEQIEVLRKLWSEPTVTFRGRFHALDKVGFNRVLSKRIPIWLGTGVEKEHVLCRVARWADGWMPKSAPARNMPFGDPRDHIPRMHRHMREADRDPLSLSIMVSVTAAEYKSEAWLDTIASLKDAGITHLRLDMPPDVPVADAVRRVIEARDLVAHHPRTRAS